MLRLSVLDWLSKSIEWFRGNCGLGSKMIAKSKSIKIEMKCSPSTELMKLSVYIQFMSFQFSLIQFSSI